MNDCGGGGGGGGGFDDDDDEYIDDVLLVQRAQSCIASLFGCVYKHKLALSAIINKMSVDYRSSARASRRATHALHLPV